MTQLTVKQRVTHRESLERSGVGGDGKNIQLIIHDKAVVARSQRENETFGKARRDIGVGGSTIALVHVLRQV